MYYAPQVTYIYIYIYIYIFISMFSIYIYRHLWCIIHCWWCVSCMKRCVCVCVCNLRFKQTSTKNSGSGSILMQVLHASKMYRKKYEIPLGWVRLEPTPATTAAPSLSESGDITTAPLRLLKTKIWGTVLCLIFWMTRRIGYIFGALAHSLYTRSSLDP